MDNQSQILASENTAHFLVKYVINYSIQAVVDLLGEKGRKKKENSKETGIWENNLKE